jgi:hypothetical protein
VPLEKVSGAHLRHEIVPPQSRQGCQQMCHLSSPFRPKSVASSTNMSSETPRSLRTPVATPHQSFMFVVSWRRKKVASFTFPAFLTSTTSTAAWHGSCVSSLGGTLAWHTAALQTCSCEAHTTEFNALSSTTGPICKDPGMTTLASQTPPCFNARVPQAKLQ